MLGTSEFVTRRFIDREEELAFLRASWGRREAQLLVLYGRRRIGKTALLERFARDVPAVHFVATRLPEARQLTEIGQALGRAVEDPVLASTGFSDWEQLFLWIEHAPRRVAIILDEYPCLVEANDALSSLWQRAWDRRLGKSTAFVVLCGSSVAMMEQETLNVRSPLYGRRTGQLRLGPLSFPHAAEFLHGWGFEDQVRAYSVAGGVPYYLRLLDSRLPFLEAVRTSVLEMGAPLRDEVEFLLRQELREPRIYFGILAAIAAGKRKLSEILNAAALTSSTAGKYLAVLQNLGLVVREVPATEKRPEKSKRGLYRIEDHFVRFWFRFVLPQRGLLETGRIGTALAVVRKEIDQFTGETYESICRDLVRSGGLDSITGFRWSTVGRWWDREAEIDLVSFSEDRAAVLLGEVKWSRRLIGTNVLAHLEATAARVPVPPGLPRILVLFSRSGFTPALHRAAAGRDDIVLVRGLEPEMPGKIR